MEKISKPNLIELSLVPLNTILFFKGGNSTLVYTARSTTGSISTYASSGVFYFFDY